MAININRLVQQLIPKGLRNFKVGGFAEKIYTSVSDSFSMFLDDLSELRETNYSGLSSYSIDETGEWEKKLWINEKGDNASLAIRKSAIQRKHIESTYQGRNSAAYIQHVLNDSGFPDARVIENLFWDADESEFLGINPYFTEVDVHFGDTDLTFNDSVFGHYGDVGITQVIANTILPEDGDQDIVFPLSADQLKNTFIITGATGELNLENVLSISYEKQREFRNLVMLSKPAQTLAFLNVVYTALCDCRYNIDFGVVPIGDNTYQLENKALLYLYCAGRTAGTEIYINGVSISGDSECYRVTNYAATIDIRIVTAVEVNLAVEVLDVSNL